MRVLTFFNHAGGASKSTLALNVGHCLAELGHRVLLIDADPQANLTRWVGIKGAIDIDRTIFPAVIAPRGEPLVLPEPVRTHGMDVIPSQLDLAEIEPLLPGQFMGQLRLREALRSVEDRYDFVVVDPPPSLGQLSALAVLAADDVVVPVQAGNKGLEGLAGVTRMVGEFRKAVPHLRVALLVPTQVTNTNLSRDSVEALRHAGIAPVASSLTYRPGVYPNSQLQGEPVLVFDPRGAAADEVRAITQQVLDAVGEVARVEARH